MTVFTFSMGGQFGELGASLFYCTYMRDIQSLFQENMKGVYLKQIKEFYIALRVSGDLADYEGDGLEHMRCMKKKGYIGIDFVIPKIRWFQVPPEVKKEHFIQGIRQGFYLMVGKMEKEKEFIDKESMVSDFEQSIKIFQNTTC